jgi:hypothetical protein
MIEGLEQTKFSKKKRKLAVLYSVIFLKHLKKLGIKGCDRGPRTDSWGTPAETLQSEEDELFINTLCCRSCR